MNRCTNVPRGTKPGDHTPERDIDDERVNTSQLLFLANVMEACTLDGRAAVLEITDNATTARVREKGSGRTARFNWSVAQRVITRHKGAFLTKNR